MRINHVFHTFHEFSKIHFYVIAIQINKDILRMINGIHFVIYVFNISIPINDFFE